MKNENQKKKIIRIVTAIVVGIILITGIVLMIYGMLPEGTTDGGICHGDNCEIPV